MNERTIEFQKFSGDGRSAGVVCGYYAAVRISGSCGVGCPSVCGDLQGEQLNFMATAIAAVIGVPVFYWLLERDRTRCPSDYRYERVKKGKYVYIILIGLLGAGALNKFLSLLQIDRIFTGYEETAGVL